MKVEEFTLKNRIVWETKASHTLGHRLERTIHIRKVTGSSPVGSTMYERHVERRVFLSPNAVRWGFLSFQMGLLVRDLTSRSIEKLNGYGWSQFMKLKNLVRIIL